MDKHGVRPDPDAVESPQKIHTADKLPRTRKLLLRSLKGVCRQSLPNAAADAQQSKKFEWTARAQEAFENLKWELCKAPVLDMPTEKCRYFLNTDASMVAISGILHQE